MVKTTDFDIVFLAYDEPRREEFWLDLQSKYPQARRVQGVKGLDGGCKAAVTAGHTDHVIVVDGDCIVDPAFFDLSIDEDLLRADTRIDWPSRNVVNGVVSGNGGIKCWPKRMALTMRGAKFVGFGSKLSWVIAVLSIAAAPALAQQPVAAATPPLAPALCTKLDCDGAAGLP